MALLPLSLTAQAEVDTTEIWAYIGRDNPSAADRMMARITSAFTRLRSFPDLGEKVAHPSGEVRRLTVDKYVIFYQRTAGEIRIIRILHSARRWETLL